MPTAYDDLRILIVSSSEKGRDFLLGALKAFHAQFVSLAAASDARVRLSFERFDLVLVNAPLRDEFGADLAVHAADDAYAGVLLLLRADAYDQIAAQVADQGVLAIPKPIPHGLLDQAVRISLATRQRLLRAQKKTESLQKKMEEVRLVNRAKLLLIQKLGMTEAAAHRLIEKQAMDMRRTRADIAADLIRTYEN